ncbi:MAG: Gfo/Idh/MocA family oxidoreductase, partial [Nanoarchaeota archaeon]
MRYVVVGLGSIGRRHLSNLRLLDPDGEFIACRSSDATLPDEFSGVKVCVGLDAALAMRPDVVVVANPTDMHVATATSALKEGCHVFIEKPIACVPQDAKDIQRMAASGDDKVMVGYCLRFHPAIVAMKR